MDFYLLILFQQNGRFGTSVALVDMNADGYNDLAISSPSTGSEELLYYVRQYILYRFLYLHFNFFFLVVVYIC